MLNPRATSNWYWDRRTGLLLGVAVAYALSEFQASPVGQGAIVLMLMIGLLHGGCDAALLVHLSKRDGKNAAPHAVHHAVFWFIAYAGVVLLGIALCIAAPQLGAVLLLLLSAFHFAPTALQDWRRFAFGIIFLAPAVIVDPQSLIYLGLSSEVLFINKSLAVAAIALSIGLQVALLVKRWEQAWHFPVWTLLLLVQPALIWFACFFCFEHSRGHFFELKMRGLMNATTFAASVIVSSIAAATMFYLGTKSAFAITEFIVAGFVPVIFGLTISHSILIDVRMRDKQKER
jgi:hypothetical protein